MAGLLPDIDPDGLLEYSVVFTDRSLNHMSQQFQQVMRDLSAQLKQVYNAAGVVIVPGGGTFAMEAVARQFIQQQHCLIIRNGWFSFRWSQIVEAGQLTEHSTVLCAEKIAAETEAPFSPPPLETILSTIRDQQPRVVCAAHVETASGIMLPDDYIAAIASATREIGGLFILDCVASGAVWVDMEALGVDVLISAPQKGWSSSPCAGLVMLGPRALAQTEHTQSSSFACDLRKWLQIMQAYENGGHAYHATMPTDGLKRFRDNLQETIATGLSDLKERQLELGRRVRQLFAEHGFNSVAAAGFEAPGVAVFYAPDAEFQMGKPFLAHGLQIAAGVPLQCDEPEDFRSFRIGLFGLEKLKDIDAAIAPLAAALADIKPA